MGPQNSQPWYPNLSTLLAPFHRTVGESKGDDSFAPVPANHTQGISSGQQGRHGTPSSAAPKPRSIKDQYLWLLPCSGGVQGLHSPVGDPGAAGTQRLPLPALILPAHGSLTAWVWGGRHLIECKDMLLWERECGCPQNHQEATAILYLPALGWG